MRDKNKFLVPLKLALFSALLMFTLLHFGSVSIEPTEIAIDSVLITQDYRWVALVAFFTTFAISWFIQPEDIGENKNIASVVSLTLMGWGSALIAMIDAVKGMEWFTTFVYPAPVIGTILGFLFGSAVGAFGGLILAIILGIAIKGLLWFFRLVSRLLLA